MEKKVSVNSPSQDLDASFCNTRSDFHIEKTGITVYTTTMSLGENGIFPDHGWGPCQ